MRQDISSAYYFQIRMEYWKEKLERSENKGRKAYCEHVLSELDQDDLEFQEILEAFRAKELGLVLRSWKNWGVIMKDPERHNAYRMQVFNEFGKVSHCTRRTVEEVLLEAFQAGFRSVDTSNALHRLSKNPKWNPRQVSHVMPSTIT